jgi:hypothetical protein
MRRSEIERACKLFLDGCVCIRDADRARSIKNQNAKIGKSKIGKIVKCQNQKVRNHRISRLEIRERISPNLSVAILSVKAARFSARSDVEITTDQQINVRIVYFLLL